MAVRAKKSDFIKVPIPESHSKPQWSQNYLVKKSLESWQNKLEENDKIYFRVPVKIVYSDDKEDITGHFDVFIFKDSDITAGNSVQFIRDILIIPGVRPRIRLIKGYHALIRVEDTLANVLRESEGPAHMEWSRELEKYKALKLKYGGELISFVSHAAANLKRYMVSVSRSTYDDVLADLLPFFITGDIKKKKKKKKKSTIDPPIVPPLSMPTICNANEISGGFKMTDNSEWDDDKMIGMEYKIKIAFDVSEGGTPFNKYRDFQFKISDLSASTQKITNLRIDNNIVRFDVNARGWHYQLTGFPEDYQLILDITRS